MRILKIRTFTFFKQHSEFLIEQNNFSPRNFMLSVVLMIIHALGSFFLLRWEKGKFVSQHIRKSHLCSHPSAAFNFFWWHTPLLPAQEESLGMAWQNYSSAIENQKLINPLLLFFSMHLLLSCFPRGINPEMSWHHLRPQRRARELQ